MAKKENRHAEHFDKLSASLVSASKNIEAPYELPEGWEWCKQNEVCRLTDGEKKTDVSYPYLEVKYLRGNKEKEFVTSGKFIKSGTKVILVDGENSGEVFTVPEDGYMGSTFKALSIQNVDENYLQFFIQTKKDLYRNNKKGSAIPHLNKELFFNMPFPLPPTLAEQQRIVNRIETMFAKLDEAKEKARNVVDSFETRKAAILHKAFTGQLKIDNEELSIEDWEVRELDVDFDIVSGIQKTPSRVPKNNPVPYLTVANVFRDRIDLSEVRYFEVSDAEVEKLKLIEKDILVVEGNGSGNEIGRCAMWRNEIPVCVHQNHIIRLRKKNDSVLPEYVLLYLNSSEGKAIMKEKAKTTAGLYNLSAGKIKTISVPYPPLNYQLSIVNFLDIVLEKETHAKEAAQTVLDQIALLKKSILARAFRGEL